MKSKKFWLGSLLAAIGLCLLISIPLYFIQSHASKTKLLKDYNKQEQALTSDFATDYQLPPKPINRKNQKDDDLIGKLVIPKISLEVPIVEGTDQKALKKGAGHLTTSVAAGENGTSVIAAHNTTFFHHIGELALKDTVQVDTLSGTKTFEVYETKVVKTGDPIYNTVTPSLVLETCYPFDVGTETPYRYLVFTKVIN
ncbi:class D sortase [Neobacillus rhizophilus]|uniref:Class D sortase n=1 Tax=Neobacillus rhizophilus TaxID=2833579 RepID=A0A942U7H8_9BACI|nr:class D sortase [Neobacillus rhizophilus]MBS4214357.1 class D sortase [Neobacillus rhizophilus]